MILKQDKIKGNVVECEVEFLSFLRTSSGVNLKTKN